MQPHAARMHPRFTQSFSTEGLHWGPLPAAPRRCTPCCRGVGMGRGDWGNQHVLLTLFLIAAGLAIGIALLGLPWTVVGIMLAGEESYYRSQAQQLLSSFLQRYGPELYGIGRAEATGLGGARGGSSTVGASATAAAAEAGGAGEASAGALPLQWVPRLVPRRFGKVFPQDIATCKQVGRQPGPRVSACGCV